MNRAIVQRAFGGEPLDVLELVEKEKPKASAGHVVVKLTARSIIPYDFVCIRQADLECFRDQQPVTGIDGCGIVDEVGEGVTKYKIGDRVIPILLWKYLYGKGQGSWQDYIEVAEDDIIPCPETIPDEVAAQLLMTECALYGSFMDLEIPQGEWFLQTAANSNFGRQIIQLAKHRGIKTINIVRRDNVIEALKALGADEVINFTKEDVISKVKEITGGKGVYAAHDAIAGTLSKSVAACVRDGGTLFMVGELSGTDFMLNTMDLHRHLVIDYWDIATVFLADRRDKVIAEVVQLLKRNVITPLIRKKYHLIGFKEALKEAEMSGKSGRILLVG